MKSLSITITIGILAIASTIHAQDKPSPPLQYGPAIVAGILNDEGLTELSGVVGGGVNQDLIWVHNDQFNPPYLFALNTKGEKVATYELDLKKNRKGDMDGDWEDIARVPGAEKGSYDLYIADTGNGKFVDQGQKIVIVREPVVESKGPSEKIIKLAHKTIRYNYPDGILCNSECMMVHPVTKEIYIISKAKKGVGVAANGRANKILCSMVWKLPAITDYDKVYTAELLMKSIPVIEPNQSDRAKGCVTGGDISADGKHLIIRTYDTICFLWEIPEGKSIKEVLSSKPTAEVTLASERGGGESIGFSFDKSRLYTVYDGKKTGRPVHTYKRK